MQCKIRPFSDLFSSKSQILNKNPRNSDYLGILGRDLDSTGISKHYRLQIITNKTIFGPFFIKKDIIGYFLGPIRAKSQNE